MSDNILSNIAILAPYPYIDSSPGLINMITFIGDNGFIVDVFTITNKNYKEPYFKNSQINVLNFPRKFNKIKKGSRGFFFLLSFLIWILKHKKNKNYKFIIGVGLKGLVLSRIIKMIFDLPMIYCSMELYLDKDARGFRQKFINLLERFCIKDARFVIIQDENRAKLCSENNRLPLERFIIFPNSVFGKSTINKTNYLRGKFNIRPEKKIILYTGRLAPVCMLQELVEAAQSWSEEYVLVIHSKWDGVDSEIDKYIHALQKADYKNKVIFSLKSVPYDELDSLVRSADIGIALYKNAAENTFAMGLSSGKIAQYIKCALPVIVPSFPSLQTITKDYKCGIAINNPAEIGQAIEKIFLNYDDYTKRSIQCFDELLSLDNFTKELLTKLQSL